MKILEYRQRCVSFQANETSLFTQPLIGVNAELVSMVASTRRL